MTISSRNSHEAKTQSISFSIHRSNPCHCLELLATRAGPPAVVAFAELPPGRAAMNTGASEEFRIPAISGSEKTARDRAGAFVAGAGFDAERVEDVKTAVSEAVLNAIEHGLSGNPTETVLVRLLRDADGIVVQVASKGQPFVLPEDKPDIRKKVSGEDRPRGWGLYLIRKLADECFVENERGVTTISMRFFRQSRRT